MFNAPDYVWINFTERSYTFSDTLAAQWAACGDNVARYRIDYASSCE